MTILCCWIEEETVRCFADARVTFNKNNPGIAADVGSKLAVIPVVVWAKDGDGGYTESTSHSLGFAFAGSSLIGSTTYLRASSITQLLRADNEPHLPSVDDIAGVFARVSTANTRDVKGTLPEADASLALVFGFCPVQLKPRVFQLSPGMQDGQFETEVEEVFPTRTQPLLIGTGVKLFETVARELYEAGVPRDVAEVFARTLRDPRAREHKIGGVLSSITSRRQGTSVDLILSWDGVANRVSEYVLGLSVQDAGGKVGQLGVAYQASEPDYPYRVGERILQEKGVRENDLATRESLRDLAVIEYMTELALKIPDQPGIRVLPGTFYLNAFEPTAGDWCYCGRCGKCGAEVPLFTDTSAGQVCNPLIGAELVSQCRKCGTHYRETSFKVFPHLWPKLVGHAILK